MNQTNTLDLIIQQAKMILPTMKDLKKLATKKGMKRSNLIEKVTALIHSFNVYTYASEEFKKSETAQQFQTKLKEFQQEFDSARFDIEGNVDGDRVKSLYEEVLLTFNEMVRSLGYENEQVKK